MLTLLPYSIIIQTDPYESRDRRSSPSGLARGRTAPAPGARFGAPRRPRSDRERVRAPRLLLLGRVGHGFTVRRWDRRPIGRSAVGDRHLRAHGHGVSRRCCKPDAWPPDRLHDRGRRRPGPHEPRHESAHPGPHGGWPPRCDHWREAVRCVRRLRPGRSPRPCRGGFVGHIVENKGHCLGTQ